MMKQMGRGKGMFARMGGMMGGAPGAAGGMPQMDPAALEKLAKRPAACRASVPRACRVCPGFGGPGMPKLPGLGGGGLPGLPKKK